MIVLGWIVLVVLACWFTISAGGMTFLGVVFEGRIHPIVVIPLAGAIWMWYLVYDKFPFMIKVVE